MSYHYLFSAIFFAIFEALFEVLLPFPYLRSKINRKISFAAFLLFMSSHNAFFSVFGEQASAHVLTIEVVIFLSAFAVFVKYIFEGSLLYNYCMIFAYRLLFRILGTVLTFVPVLAINGFETEDAVDWVNEAGPQSFIIFVSAFPAVYFLCKWGIKWQQKKERRGIIYLFMILTVLDLITTVGSGAGAIIMLPIILVGVLGSAFLMQQADDADISRNFEYYNEMLKKTEEQELRIQMFRHDLANHLTAASAIEGTEGEGEVLKSVYDEVERMKHRWTGVPILDCLLAEKKWVAGKKGINFDISSIGFSPDNKAQINLVSMLSNLIDNAFDACERVMQGSDGHADCRLVIDNKEDYLRINMENDKLPEETPIKNGFGTLKKNKQGHGYGHRILKKTVSEMEGNIFYDDKGDHFLTRVLVKI